MMNSAWLGWVLAVLAVAVGYASYGWPGVVLGVTMVVFWLLLQFSRALRVMRHAAAQPVGLVGNAVMLHARLKPGLLMMQVLPLARSLGRRVDDGGPHARHEVFEWADGRGDCVRVELHDGRVSRFELLRSSAEAEPKEEPAAVPAQEVPAEADPSTAQSPADSATASTADSTRQSDRPAP